MKFIFTITASLYFTVQVCAQSQFFPEEMVVTATSLNMRESPDKNGKKIASLARGTVVQFVEAYNNGQWVQADTTDPDSPFAPWLKVRSEGKTGWVFGAHVTGTIGLYHEDDLFWNENPLPPLHWYGVYARDSFADELRAIEVRIVLETNELYGVDVKVLKTNQKDKSKFIVGSLQPMQTGYAGPLGVFDVRDMYLSGELAPGSTVSIHPGGDMYANDTIVKPNYIFAVTGCARMDEGEYLNVRVTDYRLTLLDYAVQPPGRQDLTPWVQPQSEEFNPTVRLSWYGDIDMDGKPDVVLDDCPFEMGCRDAIFLTSKARPGEYLRKVCEHFWPGD
ncbi:MAG TPA: SH3 domain-containing protein [Saprospiraceae bacterium]|nr:SH3 domain-containing protein [Saprospiraceae bacterium]